MNNPAHDLVAGQRRWVRMIVASAAATALALVALPAPQAEAATVPVAPSNLSVGYATTAIPILNWADNSSDETAFEVERCTRPTSTTCGPYALVATTLANQTTWMDSVSGPFQYRVRAVNAAGASAYTADVKAPTNGSPTAVIAPVVPGVSGTPVNFDGSGSFGIDFITIVGWQWSFGDGTTGTGPVTTHTYAAAGTYTVMLTVTSTLGYTGFARTTLTVTAPSLVAPTNLKATSTVKRRVDLTWTLPSTSGATAVTVLRCTGTNCTFFGWVASPAPTTTNFSDRGVRSGTTYRYVVVATYPTGSAQTLPVTVKAR